MLQRANKTISSYTAVGDWVIEDNIPVDISLGNAEQDIGTLCYGDVDGSYSW